MRTDGGGLGRPGIPPRRLRRRRGVVADLRHVRSVEDPAIHHHIADCIGVLDVREWIGIEQNEVGPLSDFDCAEVPISAEYACGGASARMNCPGPGLSLPQPTAPTPCARLLGSAKCRCQCR